MPEERAGLELVASNYRAEILDIKSGNAFADKSLCDPQYRKDIRSFPLNWSRRCKASDSCAQGSSPRAGATVPSYE
jgi:hypothetical protein